jgi:uncharacterized protein YecE (DUF72 family)
MKPAWIGCSGWNYSDWRGDLYPDGLPQRRWLEHYSSLFNTVEVNNTFYRLPKREAVGNWAEQTPEGFLFACKASRYLTHVKRLREIGESVEKLTERLTPLREAGKLGPVLWQLPGNFQRDDERLEGLLEALPPGRHAIEFRHPSWFGRAVLRRLSDAGVALVIGDHPERPFQTHEITTGWTFVRFHWGARGRRGNYSDRELATWRRRIAAWRRRTEVFAYFNNDWEGFAPRNALKLAGR